MTRNEFIKSCCLSGYCNGQQAREYARYSNKNEFTDDDYVEVFRIYKNTYNVDNDKYYYEPNGGKYTFYGYDEREWN